MTQAELQDAKTMIRAALRHDETALPAIRRLLPRRQAACVELYYYHDMTQEMIAERLGITDRTVRSDLRQALEVIMQTTLLTSFPLFAGQTPQDLVDAF